MRRTLQPNHLQPSGDLLPRDQLALPGARAAFTRPLPVLRCRDAALPERPGPALPRADGVDRTTLRPVIEDAVAVEPFAQTPLVADAARVDGQHLGGTFSAIGGDVLDLVVVDPDVSRRPGAAVAAAGAAEAKAVLIPRLGHAIL